MGAKKRTVAKKAVATGRARVEVGASPTVPAETTAVLLMAYGSAPSPDEAAVRAYLDNILGDYRGATATDDDVSNLKSRYEAIGGSPLYEMTGKVARALQDRLDQGRESFDVRVAMKHSPPFIADAVRGAVESGMVSGVAIALAPFRSRLTGEAYYRAVDDAQGDVGPTWAFPDDWHRHPRFLSLWERLIRDAVSDGEPVVIFTNHSLPARILTWNDPYAEQFSATAGELADRLALERWSMAFQSAGGGNQPWLGPSLFEVVGDWISQGAKEFVIAPIGFLVDHLEVRYDIDIDAANMAQELDVSLRRTAMPNDEPEMVELLEDLVRTTAMRAGAVGREKEDLRVARRSSFYSDNQ